MTCRSAIKRYITPSGTGLAEHPSGLAYRKEEVDPVMDAMQVCSDLASAGMYDEAFEAIQDTLANVG